MMLHLRSCSLSSYLLIWRNRSLLQHVLLLVVHICQSGSFNDCKLCGFTLLQIEFRQSHCGCEEEVIMREELLFHSLVCSTVGAPRDLVRTRILNAVFEPLRSYLERAVRGDLVYDVI